MLKNFQVGFFSPSTERLVGTKYLFSDEGRFAFKKKKEFTRDMTYKMKTKNLIARQWVLKQNWHVSSIINYTIKA